MGKRLGGNNGVVWGAVTLVGLSGAFLFWYLPWSDERERSAPFEIVQALRHGIKTPEGFWVADVSGLHAMGRIPREIAEADARPLSPLVPQPRPYRGWLVVAMDTGACLATGDDDTSEPLKGEKPRNKENFAFCVYPADPSRADFQPWLIGRLGTYRKSTLGNGPVLQWPSRREIHDKWARVD
jgi:hypothetical protein